MAGIAARSVVGWIDVLRDVAFSAVFLENY